MVTHRPTLVAALEKRIEMRTTNAEVRSMTLRLSPGRAVRYKYTLGLWEVVDKAADRTGVPDRSCTVPPGGPAMVGGEVAARRNCFA